MSFNREALLSTLQALLIYMLLQASDLESTARNDVEMLIRTPVVSKSLSRQARITD